MDGYVLDGPGLYASEKGEDPMDESIESFSKDKDISFLLGALQQIKDHDGYEEFANTVSFIDSLENTLSSMMKQIVDMHEEIKTVHEQNDYLMSRAERGVKDVLMEQVKKAEQKVQELYNKLTEVKDNLKRFASDTVKKFKMFGNKALFKAVDIMHIRQALTGIRDKADSMVRSIDSLSDMVEGYKSRAEYETEHRGTQYKEESYQQESISAVAEKQSYQESAQALSYEEEMQKFMETKVSEGVTYECNQDAYEDCKAYYDKKMKSDGVAGVTNSLSKGSEPKCR